MQHNLCDFNVLLSRLICYLARNVGHENTFIRTKSGCNISKKEWSNICHLHPDPDICYPRTRVKVLTLQLFCCAIVFLF